ncbi:PREDICTED: defensin-like protein 6 [Tarenaya hassleriana]|uniref:defensin-like protein 6 n=1 Tax=Tarenaya hassleriana TaxID=28532 RepID=UPI0008FD8B66|nr:PREDICTED: defensin-like protein 6 [Tarenaya hassleriana]
MEKKFFLVFLFLLVVFASQGERGEGRMCQSKSHHFHRTCVSNHNCAMVCRTEGFSGGHCVGFRRRCFCTRLC